MTSLVNKAASRSDIYLGKSCFLSTLALLFSTWSISSNPSLDSWLLQAFSVLLTSIDEHNDQSICSTFLPWCFMLAVIVSSKWLSLRRLLFSCSELWSGFFVSLCFTELASVCLTESCCSCRRRRYHCEKIGDESGSISRVAFSVRPSCCIYSISDQLLLLKGGIIILMNKMVPRQTTESNKL